jgi:glycine hydroxymethyltransferase
MLKDKDPEIFNAIFNEDKRQSNEIQLIASENYVSKEVLEAQGSIMTNKYAEGYPGKRYYAGCQFVDIAENIAKDRLKKLFNCNYANVQPHSGSQANQAVYMTLLNPGDTILGMSLDAGGHLTHGAKPNISGKWFKAEQYSVNPETYLIDYDEIRDKAKKSNPKLIIAGFSAYSREIDFKIFREIADEVGAYLMADIAHISGLVATGYHQNPIEHAHIVTSTTHKTLRGPRGGIILSNDIELGKKIDSAIFPGIQGGPLMHVIAAKAVAFAEALRPEFKTYIGKVLDNAKIMASTLMKRNIDVITNGTDNHIVLVDLRSKNITGKDLEAALTSINITCNKNAVPFDKQSPFITSGIRIGSAACTTRNISSKDFEIIGNIIADMIDILSANKEIEPKIAQNMRDNVQEICDKYSIYS